MNQPKKTLLVASFSVLFFFTRTCLAMAAITVISNTDSPRILTQQEVRNLYLGTTRFEHTELIDQSPGLPRAEFYEKFLNKSEIQMKQQWSVLVFSGHRVPQS